MYRVFIECSVVNTDNLRQRWKQDIKKELFSICFGLVTHFLYFGIMLSGIIMSVDISVFTCIYSPVTLPDKCLTSVTNIKAGI